jgi:hypothetical protein
MTFKEFSTENPFITDLKDILGGLRAMSSFGFRILL